MWNLIYGKPCSFGTLYRTLHIIPQNMQLLFLLEDNVCIFQLWNTRLQINLYTKAKNLGTSFRTHGDYTYQEDCI